MPTTTHHLQHLSGKNHALENHQGTISIANRTITNFCFADDIDSLAGEEQELVNLVECLNKTSTPYGMEISTEKTKLTTNNTQDINTEVQGSAVGGEEQQQHNLPQRVDMRMTPTGCKQGLPFQGHRMPNPRLVAPPKSHLCTQGQLKLRVYVNQGLLTVHVLQARHLSSPTGSLCHSFVQVSVLPSVSKVPECQTEMIYNTDSPVYDEIFSLEGHELRKKKRLVVSVWHRETSASESTFMGCMSFGMKHLLSVCSSAKKGVCGWYHLLTDSVGRRKHLRLTTLGSKKQAVSELPALKEVTEVNKDVLWMEAVTIVISRGLGGFAFSIAGNNPVRVSRLDEGSQADIAGLKSGDYIVRINGQNISRSTTNSVSKIVRHSREQIVLDIQRPYGSKVIPRSLSSGSSSENGSDKENFAPVHHDQPLPCQQICGDGVLSWQPDTEESSWQQDDKRRSVCSSLEMMTFRKEDVIERNTSIDTSLPSSSDKRSFQGAAELQRDFVHQGVLAFESEFVEVMQSGIQRYSRPLRHRVISHSEHVKLFQNIEKLVAISEYLVRHLQDQSNWTVGSDGVDHETGHVDIGKTYQSKVTMMAAAYEAYCGGLRRAVSLVAALQMSSQFDNFLKEQPLRSGQPTITEFICKPLKHLYDLVLTLQSAMTSDHSSDSLRNVVSVLRNCCNQISETHTMHPSNTLISESSMMSRSTVMSGSTTMISKSSLTSGSLMMSESSSLESSLSGGQVSVEMNNLLSRLVFPHHLQSFQLTDQTRHIIYSGELLFDTRRRVKVWAVLLSDLLLLTRPDSNDQLVVVDIPIMLQDIVSHDFSRLHPSEFVLAVDSCHGNGHGYEMCLLMFCAPSIEQKTTWRNILLQRLQTQSLVSHSSGDSFL